MLKSKELGAWGEEKAIEYLKNKRYKILAQNWQNKWGEIDIVTEKNKKIVFVEVKTIKENPHFRPEDEINQQKKKQLLKMAQIYLSANKTSLETPHQIDILGIEVNSTNKQWKVRHFENALADRY